MLYPENLGLLLAQFNDIEGRLVRLLTEIQLAPCDPDKPTTPALEHLHAAGAKLTEAKAAFQAAYFVPNFTQPFTAPPAFTFDDAAAMEAARENLGDIDTPKEMRKSKGKGKK